MSSRTSARKVAAGPTGSAWRDTSVIGARSGAAPGCAADQGLAQGSGFYNAGGTFAETAGALNLWWLDRTHASKYGSYLSALALQRVASQQLGFTAAVPEPQTLALLLAGLGVVALRTGTPGRRQRDSATSSMT